MKLFRAFTLCFLVSSSLACSQDSELRGTLGTVPEEPPPPPKAVKVWDISQSLTDGNSDGFENSSGSVFFDESSLNLNGNSTRIEIVDGSDDAEEIGFLGTIYTTSSALDVDNNYYHVGLRFQNLPVEQGQKIPWARIELRNSGPSNLNAGFKVDIKAEDNIKADPFTNSAYSISTRSYLSVSSTWPLPDTLPGNLTFTTSDVSLQLQSLVDDPAWDKNDNAVVFKLQAIPPSESPPSFESFDGGGGNPALIIGDPTAADSHIVAFRFNNIGVAKGAKIKDAVLRFTAAKTSGEESPSWTIMGQDANDASPFTISTNDISNRFSGGNETAASLNWDSIPQWTGGQKYDSIDISPIIQEIVDRGGWCGGNAIVIGIKMNAGSSTGDRSIATFESGLGPELLINHDSEDAGCNDLSTEVVKTIEPTFNVDGYSVARMEHDSGFADSIESFLTSDPTITVVNSVNDGIYSTTNEILASGVQMPSGSTDLEVDQNAGGTPMSFGTIFSNLPLAQGASIANATINFEVQDTNVGASTIDIDAFDDSNPSAFSFLSYDLTSRATLGTPVTWNDAAPAAIGEIESTSNVASLVQGVIGKGDWDPTANGIGFVYSPNVGNRSYKRTLMTLTVEPSGVGSRYMAFRFSDLNVPPGAKVSSASVSFTSASDDSTVGDWTIKLHDNDNSPPFDGSQFDIRDRWLTATTSFASWNNVPAMMTDDVVETPDLSVLFNEVVSRPGWCEENAVTLLIKAENLSRIPKRSLYGDTAAKMPELRLRYTGGANANCSNTKRIIKSVRFLDEDGYESSTGTISSSGGTIYIGQTNIGAMRFHDLDIPEGATITKAELILRPDSTSSTGPGNFEIRAQASAQAGAIGGATGYISGLPRTTAKVDWLMPDIISGQVIATPDLKNIVQEIVNRPDWSQGENAILFIIEGDVSRSIDSSDASDQYAPVLVVEYQ